MEKENNIRKGVEQLKKKLVNTEQTVINYALTTLLMNGMESIKEVDIEEYREECLEINREKLKEGKLLLMTPEYKVAILECAKVLANENPMTVLSYVKMDMPMYNMPNLWTVSNALVNAIKMIKSGDAKCYEGDELEDIANALSFDIRNLEAYGIIDEEI